MAHPQLQRVLDEVVATRPVPGIVAEVRRGDETWFGSAGVADLGSGRPRGPGEHFHSGSAGKALTSAVLLLLEAEGRLSIDDPVDRWLPGLLDADNGYDGTKITIRHLLNHSSGLFVTGLAPSISRRYATRSAFDRHRFVVTTKEDLLDLAVSQPPIFEPGAAFAYSNGGYYLAAAIIEKITGAAYRDEVRRRVIEPLGLTHTSIRDSEDVSYPEPHPRFYCSQFFKEGVDPADVRADNWESLMEDPGLEPLDVTVQNTSLAWAAGNAVTTTGDLTALVRALVTGGLLPAEQHARLWTTISTEGGHWMPDSRYGLGVFEFGRDLVEGVRLRGIGGSIWGSYVTVVSTLDGEHTLAVHTNTEWQSWDVMADAIRAEFGP